MFKTLKNLINQKGFSLAEGMVTAGLLGIVSMGMLQGLKEDSKTKAMSRMNDDMQATMQVIKETMKNNIACEATLATRPILTTLPINDTQRVPSIRVNSGTTLRSVAPEFATVNIAQGNTIANGLTINQIYMQNWVEYFAIANDEFDLSITSANASAPRIGSIQLFVEFNQSIGNQDFTVTRSILVNVKRNGPLGTVLECVNLADLTALQLKQQICAQKLETDTPGSYQYVGSFDASSGTCGGMREAIRDIAKRRMCRELGGFLDSQGRCLPLGSGDTTCTNGFMGFENGTPNCL